MATAFYPQGMQSYNNNSPYGPLGEAPYRSWKGAGSYSNPVAITAGNQRPLTNRDPTNNAPYKHGLPRPLKWQYRKATQTRTPFTTDLATNFNSDVVKSSVGSSLVKQLIDIPGGFKVLTNPSTEINETVQAQKDCTNCTGISLVSSIYPNRDITDHPVPVTTTPPLCCNDQRKALKHVRSYGNTILKKNYYQTTKQYLQNRCQTYEQRAFNFYAGPISLDTQNAINNGTLDSQALLNAKPGSPLGLLNLYVAQCYPSTCNSIPALSGQPDIDTLSCLNPTVNPDILQPYPTPPIQSKTCKLVVYKPSNFQFANEGGVSSSLRTFKLGVTTLEKNAANTRIYQGASSTNTYINNGGLPFTPFIYKNKTPLLQPSLPFYWQGNVQTNPKTCCSLLLDPSINPSNCQQNPKYSKLGQTYAGPNWATNGVSTNW